MSPLRRFASSATDLACRAVGREPVVRLSRHVLRRACLDIPNGIHTNGESSLQQWVLDLSKPGEAVRIVDVGANVGQWSSTMLTNARQAGRIEDLDLHAFEPAAYTFACLSEALDGEGVSLNRAALGDQACQSTLHVVGPGAGTNSLHKAPEMSATVMTEQVATTTLDIYSGRLGLDRLTLLKIDTEGNDLAVLCGAKKLFAEQRISVVQFEYNHRWIYARSFLRDAFDLLQPFGYRLGKLTPFGVEFYSHWDADLETFVEGNYVACLNWVSMRLPVIAWWKRSGLKDRGES